MSPRAIAFVSGLALLLGLATLMGSTLGAFKRTTTNPNNNLTAAPDWVAPTASRAALGKTQGGVTGYINQNSSFYVYAQVTDTGNPASGTSTVQASEPSYGAVPLAAGSFSAGGLSYNWRNTTPEVLTGGVPAGVYNWTLNMTDAAGNAGTRPFTATVDNTAPSPSAIAAANGGTIVGRPELNDTITFTWNDPIDAHSILANWTGANQNVVVRVNQGTVSDQVLIYNAANSAQLPMGTVNLGGTGYVTTSRTFGATGTASVMSQSGNSITVRLGTQSGAGTTQASNTTMTWAPSAVAYDRAGNPSTTATFTETGTADREF